MDQACMVVDMDPACMEVGTEVRGVDMVDMGAMEVECTVVECMVTTLR